MDASKIKPWALYLAIAALGSALVWKIEPLLDKSQNHAPAVTNTMPIPHALPGSVLVTVSMVGFDPEEIPATAGQPLKLAFFRPNANNCAREIVFPDLGIKKALPPGETTIVDVTPQKSGTLGFACGMNMLKGKLIVR